MLKTAFRLKKAIDLIPKKIKSIGNLETYEKTVTGKLDSSLFINPSIIIGECHEIMQQIIIIDDKQCLLNELNLEELFEKYAVESGYGDMKEGKTVINKKIRTAWEITADKFNLK